MAVWVLKDSWMVAVSGVEVSWDRGQKGKLKSVGGSLYLGCVIKKKKKKTKITKQKLPNTPNNPKVSKK